MTVEVDVDVRPGHAADLIVNVESHRGAVFIVPGRQGHFVSDHPLGFTTDRVTEHADCPVMVVQ